MARLTDKVRTLFDGKTERLRGDRLPMFGYFIPTIIKLMRGDI